MPALDFKAMSRVIFDIETAGEDFDCLDTEVQNYFLRFAETDEEIQEVKDSLSFYPLTGQVVAIGMLNPDTNKGGVFYQCTEPPLPFEEDGIKYEGGTEKEILVKFWEAIKNYKEFITFNGRAFDCPFLIIRSAVHHIKPTKNLMPNRYDEKHIDLLERLTFYGAVRRKFTLDMWCRTFGIKSPKTDITGYDIKNLFKAGRYEDIARYCAGDLRATKELFFYWENFIKS